MFFEQYRHEPAIAVVRFGRDLRGAPPAADIEAKRAAGHAALGVMERHLGDREFFVGERYTIADIALYAYTHVRPRAASTSPRTRRARLAGAGRRQPGYIPITRG